jgi:6-phosphogluconolactonase
LSALVIAMIFVVPAPAADKDSGKQRVYFGTYSRDTKSKGIYVADVDLTAGKLTDVRLAAESDNPSFVAIHPNGKLLYAVCEVTEYAGKKSGYVAGYKIDPATGLLTALNQQPTNGGAPCHLVVDRTGKFVLSANYVGGSVCVHPVEADGKLGEASSFVQHQGKGVISTQPISSHSLPTWDSIRLSRITSTQSAGR